MEGPSREFSADEILAKAEQLAEQFEFELAAQFFERVIDMEPENVRALNGMGEVCVELGMEEQITTQAVALFMRCAEIQPDDGFAKYMNLAQLMEGIDAVEMYKRGLAIMEREATALTSTSAAGGEQKLAFLKNLIAKGCCAVVEIYMTDACFEEDAEANAQQFLDEAIKWGGEGDPEVLQLFASFRLCQQKAAEALEMATAAFAVWKDADDEHLPSFESRLQTAKLFVELDEHSVAANILERLVAEIDSVSEVWYLLGLCLHGCGRMRDSWEALERCMELLAKEPDALDEIVSQVKEMAAMVKPLADAEEEVGEDEAVVAEAGVVGEAMPME